MNLSEQAARLTELRDQILTLADAEGDLSDEDAARYAELNTEFDELRDAHEADFVRAAEYAQRLDAVRNFEAGQFEAPEERRQAPAFHRDVNPFDESYRAEVGTREAARRAIGETRHIDADAQSEAERKVALGYTDPDNMRGFDEYLLVHGSDEYTSAFLKMTSGRSWDLTDAEKHAFRAAQRFDEARAMSLTAANGGALIPSFLDPTVILTNSGTINPLRAISRVESVMTNVWTGVTSAGITLAYGTEAGDSSDVAASYQSPSVTCYKASGTIPVSIEAFEDIQGLGAEVAREIADAKDRLDAQVLTKGTGSNQPIGVVTALYGETTLWSSHSTNSAMTATDVLNTQNALPARWQNSASWIASLHYHNRVRQFGTAYYGQTREFGQPISDSILGRPAYQASDMSTALSSVTNVAFVYGDFSNFLIADRVGMAVEFIPHLFSAGNTLPNGRRGWYVHYRNGSDVVNNTAFVLSVNPGA